MTIRRVFSAQPPPLRRKRRESLVLDARAFGAVK